jgi:surface glycoprotein (TIGR04207 family)
MKLSQQDSQAVLIAALMVLSVFAMSVAFTGSAAATVDTANRDISSTEVTNGTTVTVTIEGATSGSATAVEFVDDITDSSGSHPAASDVSIDAVGATAAAYNDFRGRVFASYGPGTETITYELTIPEGTPVGTNYTLSGSVSDGDSSTSLSGPDTIEVVASPPEESPSDDGNIVSAERTIDSPKAVAGETVGVTVTASFDGTVSTAEITDTIPFKPDASNVTDIEADGATVSSYQPSSGNIFASWGSTTEETLSYEVTIPADASSGTTFTFSGEVSDGETTVSTTGNSTIEVVTDPLVSYAGSDGIVGPSGLGDAAVDFRNGEIGPGTLGDVASAFRTSEPVV